VIERTHVLEDLHWADRSTLDLIAFLAHNLGENRVLLVGAYRGDELPLEHRLRRLVTGLLRAGAATRLELGPLGAKTWRPCCSPAAERRSHRR
jgi:predicted ATPase